ncbi:MAG: hypothetical protein MUO21_01525, partial [Nitrososphaeraceae archaeon]|nr:hypothetical protein [Nitrososphaeraceae archaeon]
ESPQESTEESPQEPSQKSIEESPSEPTENIIQDKQKKERKSKKVSKGKAQTVVIDKLEQLFQHALKEKKMYEDIIRELETQVDTIPAKYILDNFKLFPDAALWEDVIPQFYSEFSKEDCITGDTDQLKKLVNYYFSVFMYYDSEKFKEIDDGEMDLHHYSDWKIIASCKQIATLFIGECIKRHFTKVIDMEDLNYHIKTAFELCICRFGITELKQILITFSSEYINSKEDMDNFIGNMLSILYLDGWYNVAINVMEYFIRTCKCKNPVCIADKKARCILYMRNKKSCFYEPDDLNIIRKTYRTYALPFLLNDYHNYYKKIIEYLRS